MRKSSISLLCVLLCVLDFILFCVPHLASSGDNGPWLPDSRTAVSINKSIAPNGSDSSTGSGNVYYAAGSTNLPDPAAYGAVRGEDSPTDRIGGGSAGSSSSAGSGSGIDWDTDSSGHKCTFCNGNKVRDCKTCDGKGYIEEYISVPNYSGSTSGSNSGWERHDCPNILCHNGKVDCMFCGGDGWID